MDSKNIQELLASNRAELNEELANQPTNEVMAEAQKWFGYEWDPALKFMRFCDAHGFDIPDDVRVAYQDHLFAQKLDAVQKKVVTQSSGLRAAIR